MSHCPHRILVVDDDPPFVETVCRGLLLYGYRCRGALGADEALVSLREADDAREGFDLLVTDLTAHRHAGLEFVERVRRDWPDLPVVGVCGLADERLEARARALRVRLLHKPFTPHALDTVARHVLAGYE